MKDDKVDYPRIIEDLKRRYELIIEDLEKEISELRNPTPYPGLA